MDAVQKGDLETVKALIQSKADVNAQTDAGWTPLKVAVMEMKPEIVKALIAAGADVNAQDPKSQVSALMLAADGGMEKRGFPSLSLASGEIVKMLLDAHADVNAVSSKGETPLHFAAGFGEPEIVKTLIAAGVNVNAAKIGSGVTALMEAVACKSILCRDLGMRDQLVEALLQAKVNVNAQDQEGNTALHYAALAVINKQNPDHAARIAGRLLDAGADPKLKDRGGKSTEAFVQSLKRVETVKGKPLDQKSAAMMRAILYRDFNAASELLKAGVDVNAQDAFGETLLMKAIVSCFEQGNLSAEGVKLAKALIAAGANVNAADQSGTTALMLAAERLIPDLVDALLQAGADVKASDNAVYTAIERLEEGKRKFFRFGPSHRDVFYESGTVAFTRIDHEQLLEKLKAAAMK